jgi:DNA-binding NarL/FixJ family response regulator
MHGICSTACPSSSSAWAPTSRPRARPHCRPSSRPSSPSAGSTRRTDWSAGWNDEPGRFEHARAIPAAERCRGLLLLGRGELEKAIDALESSQAGFEQISFPFDRARSLLALGHAFRRAGRRKLAAGKLAEARLLFEQLGASLWLEITATELRRAAPRPRRDRELTAAETRVAELVAAGATNKEVAARLFTTVATVEAHLTRVYRKLGLRSRSELARGVADGTLTLPQL